MQSNPTHIIIKPEATGEIHYSQKNTLPPLILRYNRKFQSCWSPLSAIYYRSSLHIISFRSLPYSRPSPLCDSIHGFLHAYPTLGDILITLSWPNILNFSYHLPPDPWSFSKRACQHTNISLISLLLFYRFRVHIPSPLFQTCPFYTTRVIAISHCRHYLVTLILIFSSYFISVTIVDIFFLIFYFSVYRFLGFPPIYVPVLVLLRLLHRQ